MVSKPTREFSPSRPNASEAPALAILLRVRWYWYQLAKFCSSACCSALVLPFGIISTQPGAVAVYVRDQVALLVHELYIPNHLAQSPSDSIVTTLGLAFHLGMSSAISH